jgi:hypothetical protein
MVDDIDTTNKFDRLRQQAEVLVRHQTDSVQEKPEDIFDLIHELRIHQAAKMNPKMCH